MDIKTATGFTINVQRRPDGRIGVFWFRIDKDTCPSDEEIDILVQKWARIPIAREYFFDNHGSSSVIYRRRAVADGVMRIVVATQPRQRCTELARAIQSACPKSVRVYPLRTYDSVMKFTERKHVSFAVVGHVTEHNNPLPADADSLRAYLARNGTLVLSLLPSEERVGLLRGIVFENSAKLQEMFAEIIKKRFPEADIAGFKVPEDMLEEFERTHIDSQLGEAQMPPGIIDILDDNTSAEEIAAIIAKRI